MQYLFHLLRKYPFSAFCISLIWILSFVPFFPETPLDNVEFIDKWIHVIMYGGTFIVLWIEYIETVFLGMVDAHRHEWHHRTATGILHWGNKKWGMA